MNPRVDLLIREADVATMRVPPETGLLHRGAIAIRGTHIVWVGSDTDVPPDLAASRTLSECA